MFVIADGRLSLHPSAEELVVYTIHVDSCRATSARHRAAEHYPGRGVEIRTPVAMLSWTGGLEGGPHREWTRL